MWRHAWRKDWYNMKHVRSAPADFKKRNRLVSLQREMSAVDDKPEWPAGVTVNDDLAGLDLPRALAEISPERRAYALGYRLERDRRLSVAAYLLLKAALEKGYGIAGNPRLGRGPNGKPFLPDHPDVHFNLSHSPKAAACAVADRPVGIDVEEIAPVDEEVARRVLSEDEWNAVSGSSEPDVVFARYWTRKEALVKLTGDGIDDGRLPTLLSEAHDVAFETVVNRRCGYVLTLATRSGLR